MAVRFRDWVFEDLLPTLRKKGQIVLQSRIDELEKQNAEQKIDILQKTDEIFEKDEIIKKLKEKLDTTNLEPLQKVSKRVRFSEFNQICSDISNVEEVPMKQQDISTKPQRIRVENQWEIQPELINTNDEALVDGWMFLDQITRIENTGIIGKLLEVRMSHIGTFYAILDNLRNVWFVVLELSQALGYKRQSKALQDVTLNKTHRMPFKLFRRQFEFIPNSKSKDGQMILRDDSQLVTEKGLYEMILYSKRCSANDVMKPFVTDMMSKLRKYRANELARISKI